MYPPEIARQLRRRGHDVIAIGEQAGDRGKPDAAVLALAVAEHRTIVTNDRVDHPALFDDMLRDGRAHPGLLLTSDRSLPRTKAGIGGLVRALDRLMQAHPVEDAFTNQLRWLP